MAESRRIPVGVVSLLNGHVDEERGDEDPDLGLAGSTLSILLEYWWVMPRVDSKKKVASCSSYRHSDEDVWRERLAGGEIL